MTVRDALPLDNRVRKHAVVTGAAGFIGSHLSERLLAEGWRVTGIDCFTDYYSRADKEANLRDLVGMPGFELVEADLARPGWESAVPKRGVIFHLAAQAGVRGSFGTSFAQYSHDNLVATQRVFEAGLARGAHRVVWASSSSVYGDAEAHPCVEASTPTRPRSPYGVTKRACEDLASVYRNSGLSTVGMRYFTVYGPRQRPDMAIRKICEALTSGSTFPVFGDGAQSRDFTYVSDAVDATLRAGLAADPASIYNIGGGDEATLSEVIGTLEQHAGRRLRVERHPVQNGDVRRTSADVSLARRTLGWEPQVPLSAGLAEQLAWVGARRPLAIPA
jgi:nucleoside-diphosphate-sugar epimerase